ncbi:hypothetical protein B9Z55_028573 [Caenorhabditis nigoni]|nr:hypothetical protein B9Z55_028573 [Caenorhabditis nigoni]
MIQLWWVHDANDRQLVQRRWTIESTVYKKKHQPNRELGAAEQELFKKDNPASEKHRLPAIHVEIKTKEDLHSPNLKKVLNSSSNLGSLWSRKAFGSDQQKLRGQRLAEIVPNLICDVMLQVAQQVDQNITLGKKELETMKRYCSVKLSRFEKCKRNEQVAARKHCNASREEPGIRNTRKFQRATQKKSSTKR